MIVHGFKCHLCINVMLEDSTDLSYRQHLLNCWADMVFFLEWTITGSLGIIWIYYDNFSIISAKGRTNMELRENFILASGVSQSMTGFITKSPAGSSQSGSSTYSGTGNSLSGRSGSSLGPITKVLRVWCCCQSLYWSGQSCGWKVVLVLFACLRRIFSSKDHKLKLWRL